MTFFDELGLRAAEQLEASVGAYLALASYKRLLSSEPPIRGKAALGALRCAIELGDEVEIEQLFPRWSEEKSLDADASGLAVRLLRAGRARLAASLAEVELERRPTPVAAYVAARAVDSHGATGALSAWDRAIALAQQHSDERILSASAARWIELVLFSKAEPPLTTGVRHAIVERAKLVPLDAATPAEKLLVARARLLSASKFQRASALSMLVELAKTGVDTVRKNAVLVAAAHADARFGPLDPVEADRVRAALQQWPDETERERALARLDTTFAIEALRASPSHPREIYDELLDRVAKEAPEAAEEAEEAERVRGFLRGGDGAGARISEASMLEVRLFSLGVDAATALHRASFAEAARAFVRAREILPPIAVVPPLLHSASLVALGKTDVALKRAASDFILRSIERSFSVPPNGFLPPALALIRAGFLVEGRSVLAEAYRLKEPGAPRYLAEVERRLAYDLLRKGDRRGALAGLRTARSLFEPRDS